MLLTFAFKGYRMYMWRYPLKVFVYILIKFFMEENSNADKENFYKDS